MKSYICRPLDRLYIYRKRRGVAAALLVRAMLEKLGNEQK
jgi:hypothetical protein